MLRRCRPQRFIEPRVHHRTSVAEQQKPRTPTYARGGPIHMYSNKDTSFAGLGNPMGYEYNKERMKITFRRIWSDKMARWYFGVSIVLLFAGGHVLSIREQLIREEDGLVGAKRKHYQSRLTVVLDVDETICSFGDRAFRLRGSVVPRPYLAELLDYLAKIDAEVILWSACSDRYMKAVVMAVDPAGLRVSTYLTRDSSWYASDGYYEKNIRWLRRPMDDTIIIENRPLSVRNCNSHALLVEDFVRGEYMDTGRDHPPNDHALKTVKDIIQELHENGRPVDEYLADRAQRNKAIKQIPCHLAMRQMPDELAAGEFFFIGDKYKPTKQREAEWSNAVEKARW